MSVYFQCFSRCLGVSESSGSSKSQLDIEKPQVTLDTSRMGSNAVIVKNGRRICGTGASLANTPIAQDKAYFEAKLQSSGIWGIGLANENTEINRVPLGEDANSWVLQEDGLVRHDKNTLHASKYKPAEGDIIGVSYNHTEMNFYVNGDSLNCPVAGIRGTVYPVLYVDDDAILDAQFTDFSHKPPSGYKEIMLEKQIL